MFRKQLDEGQAGDNVRFALAAERVLIRTTWNAAWFWPGPRFHHPHTKFKAAVYILTNGGRRAGVIHRSSKVTVLSSTSVQLT